MLFFHRYWVKGPTVLKQLVGRGLKETVQGEAEAEELSEEEEEEVAAEGDLAVLVWNTVHGEQQSDGGDHPLLPPLIERLAKAFEVLAAQQHHGQYFELVCRLSKLGTPVVCVWF